MTFNKIFNIVSLFSLFIFSLVVFVFYIWIFEKSLLDDIGRKIVLSYSGLYKNQFDVVKKIISNDPEHGISQLEDLLSDLESVKKGDRLSSRKYKILEILTTTLEKKGLTVKALSTAEKWSDFDNRDLNGQFALGSLLLKTPGREEDGKHLLLRLNKLAPENSKFASLYAEILLKNDKLVEAFLALRYSLRTLEVMKKMVWQIFWNTGDGFTATQMESFIPSFDAEGNFMSHFSIPASARTLRLDPPPFVRMFIEKPILLRSNNMGQNRIELLNLSLKFNQMSQPGNFLKTSGGIDPYFIWNLPAEWDGADMDYVLSAQVHGELPAIIHDILSHPDADLLETQLEETGEIEAMDQLVEVKRKFLRQSESSNQALQVQRLIKIQRDCIEVFWNIENAQFSEQRKISVPFSGILEGNQLLFDLSMQIGSPVTQLRIDFPEQGGVEYSIEAINICTDGQYHEINVAQTDMTVSRGLKKNKTKLITIGPDPYFYFSLQSKKSIVKKIRLQGRAQ